MKAIDILQNHNLVRTNCREGIINCMLQANAALSESNIRKLLSGNYNRTTFYRSFKTLETSQIIHRITLDKNKVVFALNSTDYVNEQHAHFFCNTCKSVHCLPYISLSTTPLPKGYLLEEVDILVKGNCKQCTESI